ncbi:MAG: helix-turn-helix transcriptional regulator [Terricaulis sp.]
MNTLALEILFRGIAVGALSVIGLGFWRSAATMSLRLGGVALAISGAAYALNSCAGLVAPLGPMMWPVRFFALGGAGLAWLFILVLFEDRPLTPALFAPFAVLTSIGLLASIFRAPLGSPFWITSNVLQTALAAHGLFVIARSWRDDLVEARRRLRGPLLAGVCAFLVAISTAQIAEGFGYYPSWFDLFSGAALAVLSVAGAAIFLRADAQLFGAARPAPAEPALPPADRAALTKLDQAMGVGEAWRKEGLTIGTLAEQVGVPEHRLRRLINDHLGERNFASYVNARRIDAAKRLLRDPARAQDSVSTIAFDLGFASLGPFNRTFKEVTGQTPSEWRKQG